MVETRNNYLTELTEIIAQSIVYNIVLYSIKTRYKNNLDGFKHILVCGHFVSLPVEKKIFGKTEKKQFCRT